MATLPFPTIVPDSAVLTRSLCEYKVQFHVT